ncbi:MAG: energy-coupling factor transporter ATP-binding protein EcfA2, partial [Cyclobacteriaceae bacterium]
MSEKDINLQQDQDIIDISELINPFPGLRPFGVEEGHLFFGREGQSDEVLVKLQENKFIGILGASGSGKSSFMYCGLVPSLNGGFMSEAGSNWRVVVARPGGGPIDNLAEALLIKNKDYNNLSDEDKLIKKTIIGTVLRSSSLGLVEVIRQLKTDDGQNLLIVIDQFEELFRFRKLEAATSDMDESSAFVNLLLEAVHQFDEPIYVTITMRSDFIGECAKFPDLTQMINDSHYLIPQMTRDQKRTAIEGPVAVGGGKIAPRLTQQLLNDVGDNPDQLPILQHALMRTWAFWVENRKIGEPVDLRHYNSIGTLREALSQHANEAYDSLSKREKQIAEVMFKSLTERGSENQGIRRPTKLGTISAIAGVAEDEVIRVVDKFREPGRSLLMPPHGVRLASESVVDISHESLMRIWDRLKRWLDEESKAAEMYIKLSEAAERFQEGKASLWKMPDLQLALNWKEENRPTLIWGQRYNPAFERTLVFLETSEKAYITEQRNKELLQKRGVKRMRITALVLGA